MAKIEVTSTSQTSLTAKVSEMSSAAKHIEFYIDEELDKYYALTGTSKSHTYTGLEPGTEYYLSAIVYDVNWKVLTFKANSVWGETDPEEEVSDWMLGNQYTYTNISEAISHDLSFGIAGYVARFKLTFAQSGEVTFYSTNCDDTYGFLSKSTTFDSEIGGPSSALIENDDSGWAGNFKFTYNVTAGTTYYLWVRMYEVYETGTMTICIEPSVTVTVKEWDWKIANGDEASASETYRAYLAVDGGGAISDFSHKVWNDLVDKIYEAKQAAGIAWNERYSTYEDAKMTQSDKVLTATRFNSARYNVGIHVSTGLTEEHIATGKPVKGSYFTTVVNCLNEWIRKI